MPGEQLKDAGGYFGCCSRPNPSIDNFTILVSSFMDRPLSLKPILQSSPLVEDYLLTEQKLYHSFCLQERFD